MSTTDGAFEQLPLSPRTHESFARWALCFCVYNFDVELGQKLEIELPAGTLSPADKKLLGFLAFPDSNPRNTWTSQVAGQEDPETIVLFSFRFRHGSGVTRSGVGAGGAALGRSRMPSKDGCAPTPVADEAAASSTMPGQSNGEFSFGVACFRQQADPTSPRNCRQQSVVIVSRLKQPEFLTRVMNFLGPLYYRYGATMLESALHSISSWPNPDEGDHLELPLAGQIIHFTVPAAAYGGQRPHHKPAAGGSSIGCAGAWPTRLPRAARRLLRSTSSSACSDDVGHSNGDAEWEDNLLKVSGAMGIPQCSMIEVPRGLEEPSKPFSSFWPLVDCLWALWEVALCGEPLLIFSPDYPTRVSDAVFSVSGLIAPLEYAGDYRPYFTIYDGDFEYYRQHLQRHSVNRNAVILGATNPVVLRMLSNISTCVILSPRTDGSTQQVTSPTNVVACMPQQNYEVIFQNGPGDLMQRLKPSADRKQGNGTSSWRADWGFALSPDPAIMKSLEIAPQAIKSPTSSRSSLPSGPQAEARDGLLRRHFYELTLTFLYPFLPHLQQLASHANSKSAGLAPRAFDEDAFLDAFQPVGVFASLPRQRCRDLYARFICGANFRPWIARQWQQHSIKQVPRGARSNRSKSAPALSRTARGRGARLPEERSRLLEQTDCSTETGTAMISSVSDNASQDQSLHQ